MSKIPSTWFMDDPLKKLHINSTLAAIDENSALEELPEDCYKAPGKLRFSCGPVRLYSTHSIDDYDR